MLQCRWGRSSIFVKPSNARRRMIQGRGGGRLQSGPTIVVLAMAVLLAGCGGTAIAAPSPTMGLVLNRPVPDTSLTDMFGRTVQLSSFRGEDVVLAPFLTLCHDECPLITAVLLVLERDVQAAGLGDKVKFVTVSVDPWRDTPARLAAYRHRYGANWLMLTGSLPTLESFWRPFGVFFEKVPADASPTRDWWTGQLSTMDVLHTNGYILIDARGRERFIDANEPQLPALRPDLKALLDEGGLRHLEHPGPNSWSIGDALDALSWLVGRTISQQGGS